MSMITLTASESDPSGKPTENQIQFDLHEDLLEMIHNGKYYFSNGDGGFWSQIAIDGKLYLNVRAYVPHRMRNPE
jgi:hypothetical protein